MSFDQALLFTMRQEVGSWFDPNDAETKAGLHATKAQQRKVGWVNDDADTGGATKFGVSATNHPELNIDTLTLAEAEATYLEDYWIKAMCDKLPKKVAIAHFDCAVNAGIGQAARLLQKAVQATPDGALGPQTLALVASTPEATVLSRVLQARRDLYKQIVFIKPAQGRFLAGWLSRVDALEAYCGQVA